jgi:hypothetical protein
MGVEDLERICILFYEVGVIMSTEALSLRGTDRSIGFASRGRPTVNGFPFAFQTISGLNRFAAALTIFLSALQRNAIVCRSHD